MMTSRTNPGSRDARFGGFIRLRWLAVAAILTILVLFARPALTKWAEGRSRPDPDADAAVVALNLQKMWQLNNLSGHKEMLSYLLHEMKEHPTLLASAETNVLAAATDGDFEARELAFAILGVQHHAKLISLAAAQFADIDPAVRLLGLHCLGNIGTAPCVPMAMGALDDPDRQVAQAAIAVLQKCASKESGTQQPLPDRLFSYDLAKTANMNQAEDQRQIKEWKAWWINHRNDYPQNPPISAASPWKMPAPDFVLSDLEDHQVRLADLKGKPVLISFFDPALPGGLEELSTLAKLQEKAAGHLTVLAIYVNTGRKHNCEKDHTPEGMKEHAEEFAKVRSQMQNYVREQGISFPLLVDPHESVVNRLEGHKAPTTVLIDSQGYIRRHFRGRRTLETMEAMLREVNASQAETRSK